MRLVIIESPYTGNIKYNLKYARACMVDCLGRGEAPFASHLLYTQEDILDDDIPEERNLGIQVGLAWANEADATVVYTDLGISNGMQEGISNALKVSRPVEYRTLPKQVLRECMVVKRDEVRKELGEY